MAPTEEEGGAGAETGGVTGGAPVNAQLPYDPKASILEAFAQASALRRAPALLCEDVRVSYAELDLRSSAMARAMSALGVGQGDRVALVVDRSVRAVIAMLATLKTGAAYAPLDPAAPDAYIATALADCSPALIVCDEGEVGRQLKSRVPLIGVDTLEERGAQNGGSLPRWTPNGDTPAYIMFTSGSTGRAKGVVVPHRAVVRLVREQSYASFGSDEVFLHAAPLSFDASTFEVWGALLNGISVAILPTRRSSLHDIVSTIRRHDVTTAWFTAGLFNLLVDYQLEGLSGLRQIIAGGDVLSAAHVLKALEGLPRTRIINGYGPTENTTFTCCHDIRRADVVSGPVPIGRAIGHTQVHVLNSDLHECDSGETGELYATGDGLALGYLNAEELSAEKFVDLTLKTGERVRAYRTGDMVARRADGLIDFLGRADTQVKIDGKRVELSEVERQLRQDDRVQDAAVIAKTSNGVRRLIGFIVPTEPAAACDPALVLQRLREALPAHMCPGVLTPLMALPLTPNGKVDRASLARETAATASTARTPAPSGRVLETLQAIWCDLLGVDRVDSRQNFFDLGGTSLLLVQAHARLEAWLERRIDIVSFFDNPTIESLGAFLEAEDMPSLPQAAPAGGCGSHDPIAIIGMAGRFPGARNTAALWDNIVAGVNSISHFAEDELEDAFSADVRKDADFVRARSILEDVDKFDADLFGIYPREAALTDPQHRVLLECAWEALENAGYAPNGRLGSVGVFAGCSMNTYFLQNVCTDRSVVEEFTNNYQVGGYPTLVGALADTLATRVSYRLDLRGPAVTVQSACSTSLLAVAQACASLRAGESTMALAGGVSITFPQKRGYIYQSGGMVSRDGHCRPFDASSDGTVFGSGAGIVVLKRLQDALRDGDHIHALIRGYGLSNDGAQKVGFTAPSAEGQAAAVKAALTNAQVDAASIGYVECHGTATPLGDPIEYSGLVKAFRTTDPVSSRCALGSVKANVGHLDAAAGVTGLIKAVLLLQHELIPPLTHFTALNPRIDTTDSPFYIPHEATAWPRGEKPRRAGVSSFGVGGTNVHVVLEESPTPASAPANDQPLQLLPLSAKTTEALACAALSIAQHLELPDAHALGDVATTLQTGRARFDQRLAIVADTTASASVLLRAAATTQKKPSRKADRVVFMFPGQGAQYAGMGHELYHGDRAFAADIDRGATLLRASLGLDIRDHLLSAAPDESQHAALRETRLAQPSLFILEYAVARLFMRWGVTPNALIGHSVGEFVAAALAGVFSFDQGCAIIGARARHMQDMPGGAMLAVRLGESTLGEILPSTLDIAAINAPNLCVVSGPVDAISAFEAALEPRNVAHRRLHTSHAFHSRSMDPVVSALEPLMRNVPLATPTLPIASCVTGQWAKPQALMSPSYWAKHCRSPVLFGAALATVADGGAPYLLEIGPGATLNAIAAQVVDRNATAGMSSSLPPPDSRESERAAMLKAVSGLWCAGIEPDWATMHEAQSPGRRVPLPTYPFARTRHWIDPPLRPAEATSMEPATAAPVRQPLTPSASTDPSPASLEVNAMTTSEQKVTAATGDAHRCAILAAQVAAVLENLSGAPVPADEHEATFLELGFDSLFLGQVARALETKFKIKLTFRQLLNDFPSVAAVARHLDTIMPANSGVSVQTAPVAPRTVSDGDASEIGMLERQMQAQLQAMQQTFSQQLQELRAKQPSASTTDRAVDEAPSRFRMYKPGGPEKTDDVSVTQRAFIDDLVARTIARTPKAKAQTQSNRAVLADPRTASGFRPEWKEIVYPIVAARSKGSKIWDIDGNVYIDLVNGYGQTAFGHAPDFVSAAIAEQLADGYAIGPQSPLAGEVAKMIAEMVGLERVTFCNTGSEAVMAAMRVARCVTGRDTVVVFANDYHGQFDEVLVKQGRKGAAPRALPIAPGIPAQSLSNMIVLEYGHDASLDWIAANAGEIAAVIVEPVQSRHPELRPVEFIRTLRAMTQNAQIALVFDEIVTGFRVHPGGMQKIYGVQADMATYGKVLGGGMPIGVLAGAKAYMDALDGGHWQFGDDSAPEVAPTFFAGTFVRHPLVLAAARAVLLKLKAEGEALQNTLAARTASLVSRINADLERRALVTRAETFSSWFMVNFGAEDRLGSLFYAQMRSLGVHIQEGFPCFLTTAHSDADIDAIADAFSRSLDALAAAGILKGRAAAPDAASPTTRPSLPPASGELPLTQPQIEILLAAQMGDEASCAFNESVSVTLEGPLDLDTLTCALNDVVERHEALRARLLPGEMKFRVDSRLDISPTHIDLTGEAIADEMLSRFLDLDARTPFDLLAGPLVRAAIVTLAPQRHVLVFSAHHIVCDGWSMVVILDELAACYRARAGGGRADLTAPLRFSKYAEEQSRDVKSRAADEAFWLDTFATIPTLPELPADRPRPPRRSFAGATLTRHIGADTYLAIKKAGARKGATLFATLLGAFQTLIGRLSNCADIVVGVPNAGQTLVDDQILVGHCVNFLPLRAPFSFDEPFSAHLDRVKGRVLDAFDHQSCTFGTLLQRLDLARTPDRLPLTEVQFNLERLGESFDFAGTVGTVAPNPKAFVNFNLFLNVVESTKGLRIDCDYNTDLFDAATIDRWIGHYVCLLEAIAVDPDQVIGNLPLLSGQDLHWLRDVCNNTQRPLDDAPRINELFISQALATPDAIACVDGDGEMTYEALNLASNGLANQLIALRAERPGRVAVAVDRCRDFAVAILATLKAGYAYVPLDINQPLARLQQIMQDADVCAVVISDGAPPELGAGLHVLNARKGSGASEPPAPFRTGTDLPACILFTSGSTGAPKGAEITHRALLNILTYFGRRMDLGPKDVAVAASTFTFDIATAEWLAPLLRGSRVVCAQTDEIRGGFGLVALMKSVNATFMFATPSLWRMLAEASFSSWPGLKMMAGGEPLPRELSDRLLAGGGTLHNIYGPTETTVYSTDVEITIDSGAVTIGSPVDNTEVHILDDRNMICPIGVAGHLHIGGAGLATGYFNRPDLTSAAFRIVQLPGRTPQRLYRTGDLALRLPSGQLRVLGRSDNQIKLRGNRMELEEIEGQLRNAPGVADCAVILRTDVGPEPKLVGYFVATPGGAVTGQDLAAHLAKRLPDYMTPSIWARLASLPLTAHGKLDRKALPLPQGNEAIPDRPTMLPGTALEQSIAKVWASVLRLDAVGIDQPIFALGADSLEIFRIAAQLSQQGIPVEARHLMRNPSIAELVAMIQDPPPTFTATSRSAPSLADFQRGARRQRDST